MAADGGWIVWTDPAVTPIQRHNGGWVLLVPDGSMEYLQEDEALSAQAGRVQQRRRDRGQ